MQAKFAAVERGVYGNCAVTQQGIKRILTHFGADRGFVVIMRRVRHAKCQVVIMQLFCQI